MKTQFSVTSYLIVQEPHEKSGVHLHAIFSFDKKPTKAQILDKMKLSFPDDWKRIDVKSVRSYKAAIDYLTRPIKDKEVDAAPLTNIKLKEKECENYERATKAYIDHLNDETEEEKQSTLYHFRLNHADVCEICRKWLLNYHAPRIDLAEEIEIEDTK